MGLLNQFDTNTSLIIATEDSSPGSPNDGADVVPAELLRWLRIP
jgi:hypothetical protein